MEFITSEKAFGLLNSFKSRRYLYSCICGEL